jgi:hypothetical protein
MLALATPAIPAEVGAEDDDVEVILRSSPGEVDFEVFLMEKRLAKCVFEKGDYKWKKGVQQSATMSIPVDDGEDIEVKIVDSEKRGVGDSIELTQGDDEYEDDGLHGIAEYMFLRGKDVQASRYQGSFKKILMAALEGCTEEPTAFERTLPTHLLEAPDGSLLHPAFTPPPFVPDRHEVRRQYCGVRDGAPGEALLKMIFAKHAESIVRIKTPGSECSGYWVGEGLVATNSHCVDKAKGDITIEWPSQLNDRGDAITHLYTTAGGAYFYYPNSSTVNDVAVIKVNPKSPSKPLELLDVPESQFAITIGHPLAASWTSNAAEAIKQEFFTTLTYPNKCVIGPGSSGSPVFDLQARVIGTHHAGDRLGNNYMVRNEALKRILEDEEFKGLPFPTDGVRECAAGYSDLRTPKGEKYYIGPIEETCRKVRFGKRGDKPKRRR